MRFETNEALLKDLSWPEHAMDRRGMMSWTGILFDESRQAVKATASVVVEDTTLTLRLDNGIEGGDNRNLLEATWTLGSTDGDGPTLTFVTRSGSPVTPDEARIVNEFKDRVDEIGTIPHFQPMALRNAASGPRRSPGI